MTAQQNDIKQQVGRKLREIREAKGLTLKEVANQIKATESTLSRYEKGKINASLDALVKIADALGADVQVLIETR